MKLNQLRDIVTIAEKGSLRAAARHLGIAQPAITRSIHEAEHELGAALFERRSTGVVPTTVGQHYLLRAAAILRDMERARDEVRQLVGEQAASVSIGLSILAHLALLPHALAAFRERYPDTKLTIIEGLLPRIQQRLENGELDFYVGPRTELSLPNSLTADLLFENQRVVLCRKDHPLSQAKSLGELTEARWISTSVTEIADAELAPLFAQHGLPAPRIDLHAQSALTMLIAAAHSDLLTMLPAQFLSFPGMGHLLEQIPIREQLVAPSIYTIRRSQSVLTPAAQYLQNLLSRSPR